MKTNLTKHLLLLPLFFCINIYADNKTLTLECTDIPKISEQLCISKTASPLFIYEDLVFYSNNSKLGLVLIDMYKSDITAFSGFSFSDGGKYMYVGWAEEGHEHFVFYETKEFLKRGLKANSIALISDYYFKDFLSFKDNGEVTYSLYEENYNDSSGKSLVRKINLNSSK